MLPSRRVPVARCTLRLAESSWLRSSLESRLIDGSSPGSCIRRARIKSNAEVEAVARAGRLLCEPRATLLALCASATPSPFKISNCSMGDACLRIPCAVIEFVRCRGSCGAWLLTLVGRAGASGTSSGPGMYGTSSFPSSPCVRGGRKCADMPARIDARVDAFLQSAPPRRASRPQKQPKGCKAWRWARTSVRSATPTPSRVSVAASSPQRRSITACTHPDITFTLQIQTQLGSPNADDTASNVLHQKSPAGKVLEGMRSEKNKLCDFLSVKTNTGKASGNLVT